MVVFRFCCFIWKTLLNRLFFWITLLKMRMDTFSCRLGEIISRKDLSYFCSDFVPCVKIKNLCTSSWNFLGRSICFIAVLAISICS